mgnify:CR=1 FL=1
MNKAATLDMTEGKVIRVLLVFTIPIFISNPIFKTITSFAKHTC